MTIKWLDTDVRTSSTSPVEIYDQTTDENGTTKFVRRGTITGSHNLILYKGE